MKLKQIAIALSAAALSVSALTANAAYFGDENDLSWLSGRQVSKQPSSSAGSSSGTSESKPFVRYGDENDLSWLPQPAKR